MSTFMMEILTPERTFFQGEAEALTVSTEDGEIGILKGHIPMVIAMHAGILRLKVDGQWRDAASGEGFLSVRADGVSVLVQSAEWPEEIDARRALEALRRAEENNRKKLKEQEALLNRSEMSRAMSRLRVVKDTNH